MREKLKEYGIITAGTLCMAAGVYLFKFPNNFSTGGVSGISVLLNALFPNISSGDFMMAINIVLLIVGFIVFGRGFGIKTVYSSMLLSIAVKIAEKVIPLSAPLTDQPFLELIYSVALPAVGSALLFNTGASSGGTDIVAMIFRRFTHIEIGKSLFMSDFLIATASMFVFDIKTGMFSLLGLLMKALVVDSVIENINISKSFVIITENPDLICEFLRDDLHRTATVLAGEGFFSHHSKKVIIAVMNRAQAVKLRQFVRANDRGAFMIVSNTSEIIGKGFRETLE